MTDQHKGEPPEERPKFSKHDFYFETPLYETIYATQLGQHNFSGDVDAYSARNGIDTTYKISSSIVGNSWEIWGNVQAVTLKCKRKDNDTLAFMVYEGKVGDDKVYVKIGQLPSLADVQFAEIGKKYDKHMSRLDLQDYKRAVGLAAHGVGAGSFVYLRRIFENLINESYNDNAVGLSLTKDQFRLLRMEEKVTALKDYLPSQLIDMRSVYSILSKGVHELTEQECLSYFRALKLSIDMILEQKIEIEAKQKRDKAVKDEISAISKELGKTSEAVG